MDGSDMAIFQITCSNCKNSIEMNVGQNIIREVIGWYGCYECSNCGSAEEQDDTGIPDDSIREVILREEGLWQISTSDSKVKVKITKILRHALNLTMVELSQFLTNIPGTFITGTKTEMEWIQMLMTKEGVTVQVSKK